jgi:hypothetical protein
MWKALLLALAVSFSLAAAAQSAPSGEYLCTTDSVTTPSVAEGLAEGLHTVTLSWNASSSALWYRVYRGTVSGGPYTRIADCVAGTGYTDTVAASQTLYYVVTAVNGAAQADQESVDSSPGTALVPLFDTLGASKADAISVQIGENNSTSDALAPTSSQLAAPAETLSTSDALSTLHTHSAGLAETLATSDSLAIAAGFNAAMAENHSTSDSMSADFLATVSFGESLTTVDALSDSLTGGMGLAESLSTSDAISPTMATRDRSLAETLATSDTFSTAGSFTTALGENLSTLDSLTLTVTLPGTVPKGTAIYSFASYGIAPAGACAFSLQITGGGFSSASIVTWNGSVRPSTYVSPNVIEVALMNGDLSAAGSYPVIVWLGSYATTPKYFGVIPATPAIAAARLSGGALIVDGSNFVPPYGSWAGTTVFWNGQPLTTEWISYTRLEAQPPPANRAIGAAAITVADTGCFAN